MSSMIQVLRQYVCQQSAQIAICREAKQKQSASHAA